jgi:hypothetical protein
MPLSLLSACRSVLGWFVRHFRRWNELYLLVVLVFWWPASQRILWALNPGSAAPLPFNVLHKLYFACLVFAAARAFLYVGQRINDPHLHRYNEEQASTDFQQLTPWERQSAYSLGWRWQLLCFSVIFLACMLAG